MTYGRDDFDRGVDLDLLADYVGGALDGTPEAAAVERLIADEPAWARVHAELSAALSAVNADLCVLAAECEQMPDDLANRLTAALAPGPPVGDGKAVERAPRRSWSARSWSARSWSRRRWLPAVTAATAVLVLVGVGGTALVRDLTGPSPASTTRHSAQDEAGSGQREFSGQMPAAAPDAARPASPSATSKEAVQHGAGEPLVLATGTDYDSTNVARLAVAARNLAGRVDVYDNSLGQETTQPGTARAAAPPPLDRLTGSGALSACLAAIRSEHGRPGASVSLVDFARYAGAPAVVVLLADPDGAEWAWVAGPRCGVVGAHTLFRTRAD